MTRPTDYTMRTVTNPDDDYVMRAVADRMEAFEAAARAHEMLGSQRPEDHDAIRGSYIRARDDLYGLVADVDTQRKTYLHLAQHTAAVVANLVRTIPPAITKALAGMPEDDPDVINLREALANLSDIADRSN